MGSFASVAFVFSYSRFFVWSEATEERPVVGMFHHEQRRFHVATGGETLYEKKTVFTLP